MTYITLTAEQAQLVLQATQPMVVCDEKGRTIAHLRALDPADIEAIERFKHRPPASEPGIPSERVQAFLQKLHEIDEREGVTPEKMEDLLRRTRAGESP